MAAYFVDTSALIKRYVPEPGSDRVDALFAGEGQVFVSSLAVVELRSNLQRLHSIDNAIDDLQFNSAWASFSLDLATGRIQAIGVSAEVVDTASELLYDRYITPIDALLVATAEVLGADVIVVSADRRLNKLVSDRGMRFLDPSIKNQ